MKQLKKIVIFLIYFRLFEEYVKFFFLDDLCISDYKNVMNAFDFFVWKEKFNFAI